MLYYILDALVSNAEAFIPVACICLLQIPALEWDSNASYTYKDGKDFFPLYTNDYNLVGKIIQGSKWKKKNRRRKC